MFFGSEKGGRREFPYHPISFLLFTFLPYPSTEYSRFLPSTSFSSYGFLGGFQRIKWYRWSTSIPRTESIPRPQDFLPSNLLTSTRSWMQPTRRPAGIEKPETGRDCRQMRFDSIPPSLVEANVFNQRPVRRFT